MPRGRKKEVPEIKVGDRVMIVAKGPKKGQRDAVVEIHENGDVRLAGFGWHSRKDVEIIDEPIAPPKDASSNLSGLGWAALAQTIDGKSCCFCGFTWTNRESVKERNPIAASQGAKEIACQTCWDEGKRLDEDDAARAAREAEASAPPLSENGKHRGTVDGQPAIIDGTVPPKEEPMIKPELDDLVKALTTAKARLIKATSVKTRANEEYNDAKGAFTAVADEIVEHYGHIEQLALDFQLTEEEEEPAEV